MRVPSGDHTGADSLPGSSVNIASSEPSMAALKMSSFSLWPTKSSRAPSGENWPPYADVEDCEICTLLAPSGSTTNSTSSPKYVTRLPSGDQLPANALFSLLISVASRVATSSTNTSDTNSPPAALYVSLEPSGEKAPTVSE